MSAVCQQVNQLLAGVPPHSFDVEQVFSQQPNTVSSGQGPQWEASGFYGKPADRLARSWWGCMGVRIGVGITREREHEAFYKPLLILSLRRSKIGSETTDRLLTACLALLMVWSQVELSHCSM